MSDNPTPGGPMSGMTSAPGYAGAAPSKDETNMAMLMFILGLFTGFIGPLILWLLKKEQSSFINDQGKEILNWMITVILIIIISIPLMFIIIGFITYFGAIICHLIFTIMGAIKSSKGIAYRYPFALRLLK